MTTTDQQAKPSATYFNSVESIKSYARMWEFSEYLNKSITKQERSWMMTNCKPESKAIMNDVVKFDRWPEDDKRGIMFKALKAAYPEEGLFKTIIRGEYNRIQEDIKLLGRFPAMTPDAMLFYHLHGFVQHRLNMSE